MGKLPKTKAIAKSDTSRLTGRAACYTFAAVAVAFGLFYNWPAPKFSQRLIDWRSGGHVFRFQDSHNIFYRDEQGHGSSSEVLLLIHGFPTSSIDWIKMLEALKSRFGRVIAPDLLGYGFSDKPSDHDYPLFEQADILRALLEHLKIGKVHILSHDYGDTVAQEMMHRSTQFEKDKSESQIEVKTVCLLNGGVFPEIHTPRWTQKALLNPYVRKVTPIFFNYWLFSLQLSSIFGINKPTSEDLTEWWSLILHNEGQWALPKLISYIPQRLQNKDRWLEAIQNTNAKVHFVYGPEDPINPHPFAQQFKKSIPRASIDTLPDVGHYVQWEAPEETISSYFKFLKDNRIP